jgi:ABC-type amino acid transport substrate-binding protein
VSSSLTATALLVLLACGLPRDPEGTLERVRGGELRAGAVVNPPFVVLEGGRISGTDVRLVESFAEALGARVTWAIAPGEDLVAALEEFRVDVVAGGLTRDDPRLAKLGTTRPYVPEAPPARPVLLENPPAKEYVLAVPPGENRFLLTLDRHLHEQQQRSPGKPGGSGGR